MGSVRNLFLNDFFKDIYLICQGLALRYRFMGQLTLARFRGDTTFGLASRLLSTFLGGLTGLVIWYVLSLYSFLKVNKWLFPFVGTYPLVRREVMPLAWLLSVESVSHFSSSPDCMLPFHLRRMVSISRPFPWFVNLYLFLQIIN